jgi:hypothetical protein
MKLEQSSGAACCRKQYMNPHHSLLLSSLAMLPPCSGGPGALYDFYGASHLDIWMDSGTRSARGGGGVGAVHIY